MRLITSSVEVLKAGNIVKLTQQIVYGLPPLQILADELHHFWRIWIINELSAIKTIEEASSLLETTQPMYRRYIL